MQYFEANEGRKNCKGPALRRKRGPKRCKDQRWSRIRTGSGLKLILAGSGLDRTAIFFKIDGSRLDRTEKICCFDVIILTTSKMLVVMWFCRLVKW